MATKCSSLLHATTTDAAERGAPVGGAGGGGPCEGLSIRAELDENEYPTGVKMSNEELATVRIRRSKFHGDWNYVVSPNKKTPD